MFDGTDKNMNIEQEIKTLNELTAMQNEMRDMQSSVWRMMISAKIIYYATYLPLVGAGFLIVHGIFKSNFISFLAAIILIAIHYFLLQLAAVIVKDYRNKVGEIRIRKDEIMQRVDAIARKAYLER